MAWFSSIMTRMPAPDPAGLYRPPTIHGIAWEETSFLPPEVLAVLLDGSGDLVGVLLVTGEMLMRTRPPETGDLEFSRPPRPLPPWLGRPGWLSPKLDV